jgi:Flp pilus assembly protein TadD
MCLTPLNRHTTLNTATAIAVLLTSLVVAAAVAAPPAPEPTAPRQSATDALAANPNAANPNVTDPNATEQSPSAARQLLLQGKYAEAAELYAKLAASQPVVAAVGQARALAAVGKTDEATKLLTAAAKKHDSNGDLAAELALLALAAGDLQEARRQSDAALRLTAEGPAQAPARWVAAELHRRAGRFDEATRGYKWFVDLYNREGEIKDPEAVRFVGLGAAQYARWKRLSDQFNFLVNELYPDLLKGNPDYWQAHYEAGRLYAEKFNEADAAREFEAALALNPQAAEVHAALAALAIERYDLTEAQTSLRRALEINPRLLWAHQLQADVDLANFESAQAVKALQAALRLDPTNESTLGRLAAAYVALDGKPDARASDKKQSDSRLDRLIAEVTARNPHCGEFYAAMGAGLDRLQRYPDAVDFYRQAIERMPQLVGPRGELGLVYMRLGDEVAANKVLHEAFADDPFNIRVSNTLKVLEVLSNYSVVETEHFVVKFDRAHDETLAKYAARYLEEEVYPPLVKKLGYRPRGKSLFEIFSRARNTDGHGWFSARMVGLPYIGTVGACAGRMVAMQSPNDSPQKFNWGRVLRHEFVHVVNLQQTHFNIPHWFTEALAVHNEGYPRPRLWDELLAQRVPQGKLFNLGTINGGFIRPSSSDDWAMAYCQAELYAQYMLDHFGGDALAKMLAAYADNLNTRAAIQRALGVGQEEFERGYVEYLGNIAAGLAGLAPRVAPKLPELEAEHAAKPDDPDIAARLALALLHRDEPLKARALADDVLKMHPKHPLATYVVARLILAAGERQRAIEMLGNCLDRSAPQENVLALLASLKTDTDQVSAAEELYELGAKKFPQDVQWLQALARLYLKSGNDQKLFDVLARLADRDADDLPMRKKLAQLALRAKDFAAAAHWSKQALYIDVQDTETHRMLAEAFVGRQEYPAAVAEYDVAVQLEPKDRSLQLALADACLRAGRTERARVLIKAILAADATYPGAAELLKQVEQAKP